MTPLAMLVRRLWPDRNPLRLRADRAEFAVHVVVLAAFLAGAPLTALAAGQRVAASGLHAERAQAGRHQVAAVLLHDASTSAGSVSFPALDPPVLAGRQDLRALAPGRSTHSRAIGPGEPPRGSPTPPWRRP